MTLVCFMLFFLSLLLAAFAAAVEPMTEMTNGMNRQTKNDNGVQLNG